MLQDSKMYDRWRKSLCKGKDDPQTLKGTGCEDRGLFIALGAGHQMAGAIRRLSGNRSSRAQ